jgi:hypothetical protein
MRWLLLAVLVLTACSGSTPHDTLQAAVDQYAEAFGHGDPDTAWSLVSERCQTDIPRHVYNTQVAQTHQNYPTLHVTHYDEDINGTAATVTYETNSPIVLTHQRWVNEHGWKYDGC